MFTQVPHMRPLWPLTSNLESAHPGGKVDICVVYFMFHCFIPLWWCCFWLFTPVGSVVLAFISRFLCSPICFLCLFLAFAILFWMFCSLLCLDLLLPCEHQKVFHLVCSISSTFLVYVNPCVNIAAGPNLDQQPSWWFLAPIVTGWTWKHKSCRRPRRMKTVVNDCQ